jgi:hypothetical protein
MLPDYFLFLTWLQRGYGKVICMIEEKERALCRLTQPEKGDTDENDADG